MNTAHFFDSIFTQARKDGILILNENGEVSRVNLAFTTSFGYTEEEMRGKHLRVLFTEEDCRRGRVEQELKQASEEGSASCDCYVLHRNGGALWATGELFYVSEEKCFVKIIHCIGALKLLDKFVFESGELVDTLFHSLKDVALVVIDTRMNVLRSNEGFRQLFGSASHHDGEPGRLSQLEHPLWKSEVLRQRMRELIVLGKSLADEEFGVTSIGGKEQTLTVRSKTMETGDEGSRHFLLMIREK